MNSQDLDAITNSFKEKLGEDSYALISDDIGILLTKNSETLENIQNKDKEIQSLNEKNDKLVRANGSLLQQVSAGIDPNFREEDKETKKSFNFRDAFDEKGHFKTKM